MTNESERAKFEAWRQKSGYSNDFMHMDRMHMVRFEAQLAGWLARAQSSGPVVAVSEFEPYTEPKNDREALLYLMAAFDGESWNCPRCGHAEDCATMDSADFLREYLAKHTGRE